MESSGTGTFVISMTWPALDCSYFYLISYSNLFLFRSILKRKHMTLDETSTAHRQNINPIDLPVDPNPMIKVRNPSKIDAQICAPPIKSPVICAYPTGKASSHPSS